MKVAILFSILPYIAVAILVVGLISRWMLVRQRLLPESVPRSTDRRVLDRHALRRLAFARLVPQRRAWGRGVWVLLALAHAVVLFFPSTVLSWNAVACRLYILEGLGFLIGLVALGICARALWRCFVRRAPSAAAEIADVMFLTLLLTGIVSGLMLAILYRWGSSWAAVTLTPYMASLVYGRPQPEFVSEMPFLVQLHVFSAFAALVTFPFSSLALAAIVAARRALTPRGMQPRSGPRWRILVARRRA